MTMWARRAWRAFVALLPDRLTERIFRSWVNVVGTRGDEQDALRLLFRIMDHVEREVDHAAIRLDGGVHAKHRLTRYHDFFVERIRPGERVLDLGCGKGELAHDIVSRAGADVVAVDNNRAYLDVANRRFAHPQLSFVERDILQGLPAGPFDVVVLSNVIEHIEPRTSLLSQISQDLQPRCVLLRVPARDRHWHVPLRRELGLPWFSDPTHVVEYDVAQLHAEVGEAGLELTEVQSRWGELWAEARPSRDV
jgi:SAM-dependent methyltransferase